MDEVKVGKMADQIKKAILDSGDMEHEEVASAIVQALMRRASDAERKGKAAGGFNGSMRGVLGALRKRMDVCMTAL